MRLGPPLERELEAPAIREEVETPKVRNVLRRLQEGADGLFVGLLSPLHLPAEVDRRSTDLPRVGPLEEIAVRREGHSLGQAELLEPEKETLGREVDLQAPLP